MPPPHDTYRPDIDGLRAIAVLAVVIYHAFPHALPGGFIGVDMFFVISGFLITSILQREITAGHYSIATFYARRIKRLFPALALVLTVTLIIGWCVLLRDEWQQLGKHTATGAAFIANIALWLESGYFDRAAELKPLLHLWSLGVEEQFYLIWPLLIAGAIRLRIRLVTVAIIIGLTSFAANLWLIDTDLTGAFFLPQSRFWELMIGGFLAAVTANWTRGSSDQLRHSAAVLGVILIGSALALITAAHRFPGWWALLPTVGTALFIAAGPTTRIGQWLSLRPVVFIGLISYPLYLWHWPLFALTRVVSGTTPPLAVRLILVATAVALAAATYWYVERPLRTAARDRRKSAQIVTGLSTLVAMLLISGVLIAHGVPRERLDRLSGVLSSVRDDWEFPGDQRAQFGGSAPGTVLFIGDSYIQQLYPRIKRLTELSRHYHSIRFSTRHGCTPVPDISRRSDPQCITAVARSFSIARERDVNTIVISGSWIGLLARGDYFDSHDATQTTLDLYNPAILERVLRPLEQALREWIALNKRVIVVLNPPGGDAADPGANSAARLRADGQLLPEKSIPMSAHLLRTDDINTRIRAMAKRAGAEVIDPAGWICNDKRCVVTDENGVPRFKDATHFRAAFVRCCITDFDQLVQYDASP